MTSNKKYIAMIFVLLGAVLIESVFLVNMRNKSQINEGYYEKFQKIYNRYVKQETVLKDVEDTFLYNIPEDKMQESLLKGMVDGIGDPYTIYMDKKEYTSVKNAKNSEFVSIGALLEVNKNGIITIARVFPNSSSEEAGLKRGDIIKKIDGEEIPINSLNGTKKLRGKENTTVNVEIQRGNKKLNIDVIRRKVEIQNLHSTKFEDIGYIKLVQFSSNIGEQFRNTLQNFIKEGIKGIIIDLRGNPGGARDEMMNIANIFVEKGKTIVYSKNKESKIEKYVVNENLDKINVPVIVLVDHNTADVSEALAGAIKDFKLGTIIGSKTCGNYIIQTEKEYDDGSALRVTIAEYFTPNGNRINDGIKPDIEVNEYRDYIWDYADLEYNAKQDECLQTALKYFNNK